MDSSLTEMTELIVNVAPAVHMPDFLGPHIPHLGG